MATLLITYFSASGVTEETAEALAAALDAELYPIVPEEPYTLADLDWNDPGSRSSVESRDPEARPEIDLEDLPDFDDYDAVLVGYPIWWYTHPHIINTLLDECDLADKTMVPFCTSGSSDVEQSVDELREAYPEADWLDGTRFNNPPTVDEAQEWAEEMGIL